MNPPLYTSTNLLEQRNGPSQPQEFQIYNTYSDASNNEYARIKWDANVLKLGTFKNGAGAARALELQTDGVTRLTIAATGALTIPTNTTFNFGTSNIADSGGTLFVSSSAAGSLILRTGNANQLNISGGMVRFIGTNNTFPALKRSSTTLQARLADDTAFTNIQGKLTTEDNAVAETPTATHTLTLYDASGTAYRVLAVV